MPQRQIPTQTRDSTETAGDTVKELGAEAREAADNLKNRATEEASKRGDAVKDGVADEISNMGDALRRAADELRGGSPQERTFGQMASALADVSDSVRDKDFGEMAGDLSQFARSNPLAFLGGAALLGFAGTRIARASERHRERSVDLSEVLGSDDDDDLLGHEITRRPVTPAEAADLKAKAAPVGTNPAVKGEEL